MGLEDELGQSEPLDTDKLSKWLHSKPRNTVHIIARTPQGDVDDVAASLDDIEDEFKEEDQIYVEVWFDGEWYKADFHWPLRHPTILFDSLEDVIIEVIKRWRERQ